jgi:hypothetical protein
MDEFSDLDLVIAAEPHGWQAIIAAPRYLAASSDACWRRSPASTSASHAS